MRDRLFALYYEIKYQACYLSRYRIVPLVVERTLGGVGLVSGAACIAAWPIWGSIDAVWCVFVGITQIALVLRPIYPWPKQFSSVEKALPDIDTLLHGLLMDWCQYGEHEGFDEGKLSELFDRFSSEYRQIKKKYKLRRIPTLGFIERRAARDCNNYFARYHPQINDWRDVDVAETPATAEAAKAI